MYSEDFFLKTGAQPYTPRSEERSTVEDNELQQLVEAAAVGPDVSQLTGGPAVDYTPTAQVPPARLTVKDLVYHQSRGVSPTCVEAAYGVSLTTDEQPYTRLRLKVGGAWRQLDYGWLDGEGDGGVSLLVLRHEGGGPLEWGANGRAVGTLLPGESARFTPACPVSVRAVLPDPGGVPDGPEAEARLSYTAFPR